MRRYTTIVVLAFMCTILAGCGNSTHSNQNNQSVSTATPIIATDIAPEVTTKPVSKSEMLGTTIENFVDSFNSVNGDDLSLVEEFVPSDKSSGYYRTEFRLGAYKEAVGKHYLLNDASIDIIARSDDWSGETYIRVYMDGATLDQCVEAVRIVSPIIDNELSTDELQDALNYISERKEANGYYFGNIGLVLLGNDIKGYELMIKAGND